MFDMNLVATVGLELEPLVGVRSASDGRPLANSRASARDLGIDNLGHESGGGGRTRTYDLRIMRPSL